ncbi:cytosine deaminase [Methylobacterium brachythecii]|uniref:Cytosine deaminase n=2 Tax=Methylobacterium brachythecii TaxID=1176177 RepID=A0A7W6AH29_9HYPH|nr:amidohydrolase family protein [Methylobacterium brachythecii]MBB3903205.1 cytosine deaminase [Methylobacterium brachythecii]GLS45984.1 N-acyl-D-amino-acid deacylase [Methylobacterium brachythecii]
MDIIIRRVRIDDERPLVDIGIEAGLIVEIAEAIPETADEEIDAGGRAALPGFVEPHLHLDKAFLHRRLPARTGTLEEAIRVTGILKAKQEREDVLERSRRVLDMAIRNGTTLIRAHPDVDPIQGLLGVETALQLREEYRDLIDLQIVAFPQEGILKTEGVVALMEAALDSGADVVGGCPYNELTPEDTRSHIDRVFDIAMKRGLPIDMHVDFADDTRDARFATARYIAEKTIATGYQGRVALGHVTSMGALEPEEAKPVIEALREADISIVTLPATDVYLGGRKDESKPRRGLTPVRALHTAGVNVAYSSNNIRNAFTPFGKADPLQIGNLLAHLIQFGTPEHQAEILKMGTVNAARAVGISEAYGLVVGKRADIVILDTLTVADALLDLPPRSWVLKNGRVTVVTTVDSRICRGCGQVHDRPIEAQPV